MSSGPPTWFLVCSLLVGLVAPTVAVVIAHRQVASALKVAKRQAESAERVAERNFRGTVISANRQRWLDELRSDVAGFVADVRRIKTTAKPTPDEIRSLHFALSRVRMRINSSKLEQKAVVDGMRAVLEDINSSDVGDKLEALMGSVETVAAGVWRKVKVGA